MERALQQLDLLGHCRFSQVQRFRRPGEAAGPPDRDQDLQWMQRREAGFRRGPLAVGRHRVIVSCRTAPAKWCRPGNRQTIAALIPLADRRPAAWRHTGADRARPPLAGHPEGGVLLDEQRGRLERPRRHTARDARAGLARRESPQRASTVRPLAEILDAGCSPIRMAAE